MTVLSLVPEEQLGVAYYTIILKSGFQVTAWNYLSVPYTEAALIEDLSEQWGYPVWTFGSGHLVRVAEVAAVGVESKTMGSGELQAYEGENPPEGDAG